MALLIGLLSLRFADQRSCAGGRAVLIPGLVLIALGLAWFARAPVDAGYVVDLRSDARARPEPA